MMKKLVLITTLLMESMGPTSAQQAPPEVLALQNKVMQEINANLQCSTAAIGFQQENARLKAENEELKKKLPAEPPKP